MTSNLRSIEEELNELPKFLYKYMSLSENKFDRIEKLITESKLYFAQPKSFNDPFDCNIPLSFKATTLRAQKYWKNVAKRDGLLIGKKNNKVIQDIIALSRKKDGRKELNDSVKASINKNGIASFSTDNVSTLMWAYYASGHTGISLRFNVSSDILEQIRWEHLIVKVKYQNAFPQINYYELENPDVWGANYLGTKSIAWKHENEWRLVSVGRHGLLSIPDNMVDGIIFGLSTDKGIEKRIRQLVEESKADIELLRIAHKQGSYELEVVPA